MLNRLRTWLAKAIYPSNSNSWGYGRAYRGARPSENHPCWTPQARSGDAAIRDSWWRMTSRIREQIINDPTLSKAHKVLCTLTLGPGIITYADVRTQDGTLEKDFNDECDYWFDFWSEYEADYKREKTLDQLVHMTFSDTTQAGNAFMIETTNPDNEIVPLCYQLLEWEQVCREYDRPGDEFGRGRIVNGIEYDMQNRKRWLYIYSDHPYSDLRAGNRIDRIPWERVIHSYLPTRISSDSGATWFSTQMLSGKDMDWYLSNELASAAVGAALTMVVKSERENPNSVAGTTGHPLDGCEIARGDTGGNELRVEYGQPTTAYLRPDEEASIVESGRPNRDAAPFIDLIEGRVAQGTGVSKQRLTGDAAGANFASMKAAHEDDAAAFAPVQLHVINQLVKPVRRRFTQQAVAARKITSVSTQMFSRQRYRYQAIEAIGPGIVSADGEKDSKAARSRMGSLTSNAKIECARMGHNWKKVARGTREVNDLYEELNLVADYSAGQGMPIERTSTEQPDESELEENEVQPNARP